MNADLQAERNRAVCDALLAEAKHGWDGQEIPEDPTDYELADCPDFEDQSWWNEMNEEDALSALWDQPCFFLGRDREALEYEQQELADSGIVIPVTYPLW